MSFPAKQFARVLEQTMRETVAAWGASHQYARAFGLRCEARMPAMDGEQSRHAQAALSEMYWTGAIDRAELDAGRSEIDRAARSYWVRGKVEYIPSKGWARRAVVALLERDGRACWLCSEIMPEADRTIEHRLALSLGGTDDLDNLVLTHRACNQRLGNLPVAEKDELRAALSDYRRIG